MSTRLTLLLPFILIIGLLVVACEPSTAPNPTPTPWWLSPATPTPLPATQDNLSMLDEGCATFVELWVAGEAMGISEEKMAMTMAAEWDLSPDEIVDFIGTCATYYEAIGGWNRE